MGTVFFVVVGAALLAVIVASIWGAAPPSHRAHSGSPRRRGAPHAAGPHHTPESDSIRAFLYQQYLDGLAGNDASFPAGQEHTPIHLGGSDTPHDASSQDANQNQSHSGSVGHDPGHHTHHDSGWSHTDVGSHSAGHDFGGGDFGGHHH